MQNHLEAPRYNKDLCNMNRGRVKCEDTGHSHPEAIFTPQHPRQMASSHLTPASDPPLPESSHPNTFTPALPNVSSHLNTTSKCIFAPHTSSNWNPHTSHPAPPGCECPVSSALWAQSAACCLHGVRARARPCGWARWDRRGVVGRCKTGFPRSRRAPRAPRA